MLSAKDFFKPQNKYNEETKNQLWCSVIADSHDSICCCELPFAHLLASIFPPGHQDRNKTIDQILKRDYKELCLSTGGKEETDGGKEDQEETNITSAAALTTDTKEKDYIEDADLTELIAAAEEENKR